MGTGRGGAVPPRALSAVIAAALRMQGKYSAECLRSNIKRKYKALNAAQSLSLRAAWRRRLQVLAQKPLKTTFESPLSQKNEFPGGARGETWLTGDAVEKRRPFELGRPVPAPPLASGASSPRASTRERGERRFVPFPPRLSLPLRQDPLPWRWRPRPFPVPGANAGGAGMPVGSVRTDARSPPPPGWPPPSPRPQQAGFVPRPREWGGESTEVPWGGGGGVLGSGTQRARGDGGLRRRSHPGVTSRGSGRAAPLPPAGPRGGSPGPPAPPPRLAGVPRSVPGDVSGLPAGLDVLPAFPRL